MRIYVFCGPTISPADAKEHLDAEIMGPAAQGDIYRVSLDAPDAIGLIDGYFDSVPSVWHKEILWALHRGIHVYGSASMGALRAAELAPFGMIGVGRVYERIASGELEDDDEVAVSHGTSDVGYRGGSEAMVNIRATLERAAHDGILTSTTAEALTSIAKRRFYAERSWPALLLDGRTEGLPDEELRVFREWLPSNTVNQKRLDAIQMLRLMADHARTSRAPFAPRFAFEQTVAWQRMIRRVEVQPESTTTTTTMDQRLADEHPVVEEAQVASSFASSLHGSLVRALAVEHARMTGRVLEGEVLYTAIEAFRRERALSSDVEFERWLEDNDIGDLEFFKEEAQARLVQMLYRVDAIRMLPNHLRSTGDYRRLVQRARDKARAVAAVEPTGRNTNPSRDDGELFHWYFVKRLGRPLPPDLDAYARELGMRDAVALRQAVWRERIYVDSLSTAN